MYDVLVWGMLTITKKVHCSAQITSKSNKEGIYMVSHEFSFVALIKIYSWSAYSSARPHIVVMYNIIYVLFYLH